MRPLRLEIEGFSTFRDRIEVDLDGCDFFALVGPTGAGKSSVIDAMTFALYGSIPRLDRGRVGPVITQGQLEARVRFDFSVGGDEYTAIRVVRRTPQGATTREARLERGGAVLAGDADGLTAEIERLLGLSFDHFTKCVVLPQGEFARFLHDTPAHRQDLLVTLLDLSLYERMRQRAAERAEHCAGQTTGLRQRLGDLDFAVEEGAIEKAGARVREVETLMKLVEDTQPELDRLAAEERRARDDGTLAERRAQTLGDIRVPDKVPELSRAVADAEGARATRSAAVREAEGAVDRARKARRQLGDPVPLYKARGAHEQLGSIDARLAGAEEAARKATVVETKTAKVRGDAEEELRSAEEMREHLKLEHRAHDLARTLKTGEPCPVCRQVVKKKPTIEAPDDLTKAERTAKQAKTAFDKADAAYRAAANARTEAGAALKNWADQRKGLSAHVAGHEDLKTLDALIAKIESADAELETARKAEAGARRDLGAADEALDAAKRFLAGARGAFGDARDRVAELSPPSPGQDDLAADWEALATWAREHITQQNLTAATARAAAEAAAATRQQRVEALTRACADAQIELDGAGARDACVRTLERARFRHQQIKLAKEEVERIGKELAELEEEEKVSRALAAHLKANAFEKWVLDEAIETLLDGATGLMHELSAGQYSLALDRYGNFTVIDHRSADEVRSARTLSGGETFLASLALALSLADRIAQLASKSAVRLESVFLDEGFGSLDPETLDVVGAAIENLAAGARMVGIVTHVRDLAERVPVRFEVRKGPHTSTVEKVIA